MKKVKFKLEYLYLFSYLILFSFYRCSKQKGE
jgi:hypothetical protein